MKIKYQDEENVSKKAVKIGISNQQVVRSRMLEIEMIKLETDYAAQKLKIMNNLDHMKRIMPYDYKKLLLHFYEIEGGKKGPFSFRGYGQEFKTSAPVIAQMIQRGTMFLESSIREKLR